MSLRNPRFMFDHLLRYLGDSFITGPEATNFPHRRLIDGLNGPLWQGSDGSVLASIMGSRLVGTFFGNRFAFERIIIPSTLVGYQNNLQRVAIKLGETNPPTTVPTLKDGTAARMYSPPDLFDFELSAPNFSTRLQADFYDTAADAPQEAGELFATRIFEPSVGHIPVWDDVDEPNNMIATTQAGNTYSFERGDPRRIWRLRYERVGLADTAEFDRLRRVAGLNLHGFWIDPPAAQDDVQKTLITFVTNPPEATGSWTPTNLASQLFPTDSNGNPSGSTYLQQICNGTSTCYSTITLTTPVDFTDKFIAIDVWAGNTFVDVVNSLGVAFSSDAFASNKVEYDLGKFFVLHNADSTWRRIFIDPTILVTASIGSTTVPPDLRKINGLRFIFRPDVSLRTIRWANCNLVGKSARPKFVELTDYTKKQSSPNPSVKQQFDIELTLREVLS